MLFTNNNFSQMLTGKKPKFGTYSRTLFFYHPNMSSGWSIVTINYYLVIMCRNVYVEKNVLTKLKKMFCHFVCSAKLILDSIFALKVCWMWPVEMGAKLAPQIFKGNKMTVKWINLFTSVQTNISVFTWTYSRFG